jgi:hypothetical protein
MDGSDSLSSDGCSLHSELRSIKSTLHSMMDILTASRDSTAALSDRVSELENAQASVRKSKSDAVRWTCPVCWEPFKHRESFKGHVRRLTIPPTDRTHCFLDGTKADHISLLSHPRYGDGDFASRAASFAQQLYECCKSNSTSTRTSESSHAAVSPDEL